MSNFYRSPPAWTRKTNCSPARCKRGRLLRSHHRPAGKGKEVQAIVVFGQVPGEVEMVATKQADTIKSMADVKGKTLGVTGLGSSTNFLTQYLAHLKGMPNSDYTLLPVGADNSFIAAIKQNRIDAGMTTEPTVSQLLKSGDAKVLVDMRSLEGTRAALGGTYPASSLYVQSAWPESHKDEAQKLARAFVQTLNSCIRIRPTKSPRRCRRTTTAVTRPLRERIESLAADVHRGRQDARRWPRHRAEGARRVQPVGEG